MGQKANLITLRKSKTNLNLLAYDSKSFINKFKFLKYFMFLLANKGIWVTQKTLNYVGNKIYFNLTLYYRSSKITFLKKKGFIKKIKSLSSFNIINKSFSNLFKKNILLVNQNLLIICAQNLNKKINTAVVTFFYHKIKRFTNIIFARRFNLFIDFLKVTTLLCLNKIDSLQYIQLLAQTFKSLPKRSHTRFFAFLKLIFKAIIIEFPKKFSNLKIEKSLMIYGIKFITNGKLQGKARASSRSLIEGSVPVQSFNQNIDFSKIHAYNILGAFGLKLWIFKK